MFKKEKQTCQSDFCNQIYSDFKKIQTHLDFRQKNKRYLSLKRF